MKDLYDLGQRPPLGEVPAEVFLHRVTVTQKDLAPHAAGEIEKRVGRADQHVGRLVEDVAVLDKPLHGGEPADHLSRGPRHDAIVRANCPIGNATPSLFLLGTSRSTGSGFV